MILEIVWTVIPLGLSMVMFAWGASIFFTESRPPADAMEIYVTGKQWMWKIQHMEGAREINELHVPVNRDIRLTMTSEDVIHDFYVPAFRTKTDVLPGRYTTEWFRPTKVGEYHIFCAEYCGTKHSGMIGTVYVMNEADYNAWLGAGQRRRLDGGTGPVPVQPAGLRQLPRQRHQQAKRPLPEPERCVRDHGGFEGRHQRESGRILYPRIGPLSAGEDRRRL